VWAVRIAATEKGVPYTFTPLRPNTAEVGAIHPFRQDPGDAPRRFRALRVESHRHVHRPHVRRPALIPADAKGAALTEQWISCVNTLIDPTCVRQYIVSYVFPGTPDGARTGRGSTRRCRRWKSSSPSSTRRWPGTGHLVGDTLTFADMNLFPIAFYLQRFPREQAMMQGQKHSRGFVERMLARPSVKATTPPPPPKKD
jgi:glutathione S-transferase